jgi:hypothetical protein
MHEPVEQVCPVGQTMPHDPQFALSLCVSAQYGELVAVQSL